MNALKEVLELVDTFDVTTEAFAAPSSEQRWSGRLRIIIDGWGYPIAVVAEFATHWGDRLVVCEIIPVDCHGKRREPELSDLISRVRRRLAVEIMCFLEEMQSLQTPNRRGPFEVTVGREGDGI
jgi:hypothetical protein